MSRLALGRQQYRIDTKFNADLLQTLIYYSNNSNIRFKNFLNF